VLLYVGQDVYDGKKAAQEKEQKSYYEQTT
jgi:hypothetical protein